MQTKLAALAAVGGLAVAAQAQQPAQPLPAQSPQVIRWNGGYMVTDASGNVVVRQAGVPGKSTTVLDGVGNGIGNRIVVDNGPGGTTIVRNTRAGVGNKVLISPYEDLIDIDDLLQHSFGVRCPKPAPKVDPEPVLMPPSKVLPATPQAATQQPVPGPELLAYKGKENTFWTKKAFSEGHDCNLYWSPTDKIWFRYVKDDDTYRPVLDGPPAPM